MQYPDEFIVQVKGTIGMCGAIGDVVTSLIFITNKQVYGPYGNEIGQKFESLSNGKVVGFFGKSGTLLDQFGVLYQPGSTLQHLQGADELPSAAVDVKGKNVALTSDSSGGSATRINEDGVVVEGPWGGEGGKAFHDGHGRIVEIIVTYQKSQINSLQAAYEHGGVTFLASLHGISCGNSTTVIYKLLDHDPKFPVGDSQFWSCRIAMAVNCRRFKSLLGNLLKLARPWNRLL